MSKRSDLREAFIAGAIIANHNWYCSERGDSKYCIDDALLRNDDYGFDLWINGKLEINKYEWVSLRREDVPETEKVQAVS
jgi:hypothetical protein